MRGDHYQISRTQGLNVTSVRGDMFIPPDSLQASDSTTEIGPVDWVIVSLKSSALDVIPELIKPLMANKPFKINAPVGYYFLEKLPGYFQ